MSNAIPSSHLLSDTQAVFIIDFFSQNPHLLPSQHQNLPSLLNSQRIQMGAIPASPSDTAQSDSEISPAEYSARLRDLERREREVSRREDWLESHYQVDTRPSGGNGKEGNAHIMDQSPSPSLSGGYHVGFDALDIGDGGFDDKWFQAQAEDFDRDVIDSSVNVWLAAQVDDDNPNLQNTKRVHESESEGDQPGARAGQARPRVAHAGDCHRNGRSVTSHKRRKAAHTAHHAGMDGQAPEMENDESVESEQEDRGDEHEGDRLEDKGSSRQWVVSSVSWEPSQKVQNNAQALLVEIGMGEGTWINSAECDAWVQDLADAVTVRHWGNEDSLIQQNLVNITQRLKRVESVGRGVALVRMINELMFAAKIASILHYTELHQERMGQSQRRSSVLPILTDLMRKQDLALSSLIGWYSAGSRWARLAAGGTVYLLMLIARKSGLDGKIRGRTVNSLDIISLSNMLRAPSTPVPLIVKLAKTIPFKLPTLFNVSVRDVFDIPEVLDCRDLRNSDIYFDRFFQRHTMALPRVADIWNLLLNLWSSICSDLPDFEIYSAHQMTQAYLTGSSEGIAVYDAYPESDSGDEKNHIHPPAVVDLVKSFFPYERIILSNKRKPFPVNNSNERNQWTNKQRCTASGATLILSLEALGISMRERFYPPSNLSKAGLLMSSQKWINVDNSVIKGREIKIKDVNDKLICYTNGTLSDSYRERLQTALVAYFSREPASIKLISRKASEGGTNPFTTFHFSMWSRYSTSGKDAPSDIHPYHLRAAIGTKTNTSQFFVRPSSDIQDFSKEYEELCDIFGDVLRLMVTIALAEFPEELKDVVTNVDIFPLNDSSPISPFTSFVLNINVETGAHRDDGDCGLCLILALGHHTGGELCLYEPRIMLNLVHGDWVAFDSKSITHFNMKYNGIRCSAVIHSDKTGIAHQKDGNGWDGNNYVL
ncbi:hypothetical protein F5050DRAFT_1872767 [Lentinula boryana]|uniref:Uncharacterized protein n=1 Tax=Lentinula boryana TaxID=40481 RepID=A0ABQ8PXL5_9AGAR|nr:hypothetical protein F5050DRAFT_1872767 [Lentinula boryana]